MVARHGLVVVEGEPLLTLARAVWPEHRDLRARRILGKPARQCDHVENSRPAAELVAAGLRDLTHHGDLEALGLEHDDGQLWRRDVLGELLDEECPQLHRRKARYREVVEEWERDLSVGPDWLLLAERLVLPHGDLERVLRADPVFVRVDGSIRSAVCGTVGPRSRAGGRRRLGEPRGRPEGPRRDDSDGEQPMPRPRHPSHHWLRSLTRPSPTSLIL